VQGRVAGTLNWTITISLPAVAGFKPVLCSVRLVAAQASSPPRFTADIGGCGELRVASAVQRSVTTGRITSASGRRMWILRKVNDRTPYISLTY
jgi:hypothetical protein